MIRFLNMVVIIKNDWTVGVNRTFHILPSFDYVESEKIGPKLRLSWAVWSMLIVTINEETLK